MRTKKNMKGGGKRESARKKNAVKRYSPPPAAHIKKPTRVTSKKSKPQSKHQERSFGDQQRYELYYGNLAQSNNLGDRQDADRAFKFYKAFGAIPDIKSNWNWSWTKPKYNSIYSRILDQRRKQYRSRQGGPHRVPHHVSRLPHVPATNSVGGTKNRTRKNRTRKNR
jgi:hypothetical protein